MSAIKSFSVLKATPLNLLKLKTRGTKKYIKSITFKPISRTKTISTKWTKYYFLKTQSVWTSKSKLKSSLTALRRTEY